MLELGATLSQGKRLPGPGSAIRAPWLRLLCIENEEFSRAADPTARTLEMQQQHGGDLLESSGVKVGMGVPACILSPREAETGGLPQVRRYPRAT